ncbi:MAG: ATP-binding protein [candidate division KSB1 bacterium]|nr:ATP-binding protein [candidate division KSB1 bacterium]
MRALEDQKHTQGEAAPNIVNGPGHSNRIAKYIQKNRDVYEKILNSISQNFYSVTIQKDRVLSLSLSRQCEAFLGYTQEELEREPQWWQLLLSPEDEDKIRQYIDRSKSQSAVQPVEHRIRCRDGQIRMVRNIIVVTLDPQNQLITVDGILIDVTENRASQEKLRLKDRLLMGVARASQLLMSITDLNEAVGKALAVLGDTTDVDRIYIFENRRASDTGELLASQRYEWSKNTVEPQIDNPELQNASYEALGMQRWYEVLSRGNSIHGPIREFPESERALLESQGIQSLLVVPVFTSQKHFWGFIGFDDCSTERIWSEAEESILKAMAATLGEAIERNRAMEAIIAEKERLAVTLKSIGEGVIATDIEGRVQLMNHAAELLLECSQNDMRGERICDLFHIREQGPHMAHIGDFVRFALEKKQSYLYTKPRMLVTKTGKEKLITFSISPILGLDKKILGTILVFRDITAQKFYQEEILKANKLESIGILAGGIAHDFNNILGSISGNISLAKLSLSRDDEVYALLTETEAALKKAHELTLQLLTFAKGGKPVKKLSNIEELIRESAGFVLRGSNIKCEFELAGNLYPVEVDTGQFHQVIQNLLINAQEAMPSGGIVHIRAENCEIPRDHFSDLEPGPYVQITVKDHGIGVPEDHLSKIFDPYFTTKQKGSGLGLAICYSIIRQHGGYIGVTSELGKGTTFRIYLPASNKEKPKEKKKASAGIKKGHGRVLFLDDEKLIQNVGQRMLMRMGFDVEVVETGEQAVNAFIRALDKGRPFDLVILDLTIPGEQGGKDVLQLLRQYDPKIKAIVMSGYSNDLVLSDYQKYGFQGVLEKPFDLNQMNEAVFQVLQPEAE